MTYDEPAARPLLMTTERISDHANFIARARRFSASAAIAAATFSLHGCASKPGAKQPEKSDDSASARSGIPGSAQAAVDSRLPAEIVRERLLGKSNGLEIRRWTVLDGSGRSLAVIDSRSDGCAVDEAACQRLRSNGLRFARVPADQVEAIVSELGGATTDRNEWHGQVFDWASLREQLLDSRGTAIAIDGRVRRFDRGEFRLLVRAWTVPMEEGPCLHLELLPQHRVPQPQNLRLLMGDQPEDMGEAFTSLALDLPLQAGYAYVLISESPGTDWANLDAPAPEVPTIPPSMLIIEDATGVEGEAPAVARTVAPPPPVAPQRPRVGPDDAIGPEAGAPRTLGEVLLPSLPSPPLREILVFVPKIPDELFPPVYESDLTARRARPQPSDSPDSPASDSNDDGGRR